MLLTALLLLSAGSLSGAVAQAEPSALAPLPGVATHGKGEAVLQVELISASTVHSFEGALAVLDPIQGLRSKFKAAAHRGVEIRPLSADGMIEFRGIHPGFYRLHLVDALGMPFLPKAAPVFVSAVAGAPSLYRTEFERLHLVEGTVVESSVGDPIAGASVRVDPRFELGFAPLRQVVTDEEGVYRAYTSRNEVVVIDSPDYRSMNARFGALKTAGTIRMKPMLKRRVVRLGAAPGAELPSSLDIRLSYLPPTLDDAGSPESFTATQRAEGGMQFENVDYRRSVLTWKAEQSSEGHPVTWFHEFLPKRAGGNQKVTLPSVELRPGALRAADGIIADWRVSCDMLVDRRTLLRLDTRTASSDPSSTLRLPSLPAEAPTPEWTLRCAHLSSSHPAEGYELRWRGEGSDPAAGGATGLLREVRASDVDGPMAIVFDGEWLSYGTVDRASRGTALVPAIGSGDLYGSSTAVRGDVVRQKVSEAADAEASLRLPEVGELAALDLQFLRGDAPERGLVLRVVQKDAVITDEVLDLLGETPLVTDASGRIYLRDFVPGKYELRLDASKSRAQPALGAVVIDLVPGANEPRVIPLP